MPVNLYPIRPTVLAAAFVTAFQSAAFAQISLTETVYTEGFDTVFADGSTAMPDAWSVVGNGNALFSLQACDGNWAGSIAGYNGALQADITQPGDSLADRGLSLYSTGQNESRHITASFLNDTGGKITQLAVSFDVALYASYYDSVSVTKSWDGFFLRLDPGTGSFAAVSPSLQATFTSDMVTFTDGVSPWDTGNGWATAAMFNAPQKQTASGTITGLSIPPGSIFQLRWVSFDGGRPTTPAGYSTTQQKRMNIGVDNLSITPTIAAISGFAAWQDSAFPPETPSADREAGADPDFDGVNNLLEYAFGSDPKVSTGMPAPAMIEESGNRYLQLQWTRPDNRTDLTTLGEASPDLTANSWSSAPADISTIISPAAVGMETVTIRLLSPLGSTSRKFLHARITLNN